MIAILNTAQKGGPNSRIHRPLQVLPAGAGVNGQRVQALMAHERGHHGQGRASVDEVLGEGVTQRVGRQALDVGHPPVLGNDAVNARTRERPPLAQEEVGIIRIGMPLPFGQPRPQGLAGFQPWRTMYAWKSRMSRGSAAVRAWPPVVWSYHLAQARRSAP